MQCVEHRGHVHWRTATLHHETTGPRPKGPSVTPDRRRDPHSYQVDGEDTRPDYPRSRRDCVQWRHAGSPAAPLSAIISFVSSPAIRSCMHVHWSATWVRLFCCDYIQYGIWVHTSYLDRPLPMESSAVATFRIELFQVQLEGIRFCN
jgi:hypothetical protein